MMFSALSLQTCCRISLSSKTVDSQSLEYEKGVILTLSNLISYSSGFAVEEEVSADEDKPPDEDGVEVAAGEELRNDDFEGVLGILP
jgi:hypothetical protein